MTCDEARDAFSDLYDGVLSGAPLVALSRHLDECRACQAEWMAFRQAMRAVADLGVDDPASGFATRVVERIERPSWWRRAAHLLVFPLPVKLPLHAAALVLLVVAGWWMVREVPEIEQAARVQTPPPVPQTAPPVPPAPAPAPVPLPPAAPKSAPAAEAKPEVLPPSVATGEFAAKPPSPAAKQAAPPTAAERPVRPPGPSPAPPAGGVTAQKELSERLTLRAEERALGRDTAEKAALPEARGRAVAPPPAPAPLASGAAPRQAIPAPGVGASLSADERFSGAANAFAAREYAGAVEGFRTFLAEHPHDPRAAEARFYLADSLFAQGRYAEAAPLYAEFLRERPDHRLADTALYRQGLARLAAGDTSGCALLKSALERAPRARDAAAARDALARCP